VVDFLLGQGVDIDAQNGYRQSAVHLAALGGRLDTVQLLVNRGAQLEFRNVWGGTTLESTLWAAINHDPTADYVPIVEALLKGGAKVQSGLTDWWREQKVLVPSAKPRIEELLRRYEGTIPIRH
jgi:ankyrin repeat protein